MELTELPQVSLLTRPGCHLCDDARIVVDRVTSELGLGFEEINIEEHPQLKATYNTEIPVVRVNGVPKDFWQINARRLTKILRAELRKP